MLAKTDQDILSLFDPLWNDVPENEAWESGQLYLAHYTTIPTLEKIVSSNEIWFSNPLLMNDLEEIRFGIQESRYLVRSSKKIIEVCAREERYWEFINAFDSMVTGYASDHAYDTYVFCMSEHDVEDNDGLLSMWRGYGSNGKGVAIVIDPTVVGPIEVSPIVLAKVQYGSAEDRRTWIASKLDEFLSILEVSNIRDDKIWLAARALFDRMKSFAIFTKHTGFREEKEWRAVYMPERDRGKKLNSSLGYLATDSRVEPKLKLPISPIEGVTGGNFDINSLVHRIILGPSLSSDIYAKSIKRMLTSLGCPQLASKVVASTTPFRPI